MNNENANFTSEQKEYKILTPFKLQVMQNFPFIAEDFDSLTEYNLLQKIVGYLNDVIYNTNNVTENTKSLYNAYVSLQNYINEYFNNLDVQDEINNKLNEMAESGEITNLIKKYVDPIYQNYENEINSLVDNQNKRITSVESRINSVASGSPTPVTSINDMTDTTKTYLLTTDGYWYYYNGSTWTKGAVYQNVVTDNYTSDGVDLAYNIPFYDYRDFILNTMSISRASINIDTGNSTSDQNGKRLRTGRLATQGSVNRGIVAKMLNSDYQIAPRWYSDNKSNPWSDSYIEGRDWGNTFYMGKHPYVAFIIRKSDESEITDDDISVVRNSLHFYFLTDKNLTEEDVPADSKAVGDYINSVNNNFTFKGSMSMYARFGICGASWDSGYYYTSKDSSPIERGDLSWGANVSRRNGNKFYNFSRHSMNTREYLTNQYCLPKLLKSDVCDLYIITLGGNDSNYLGMDYLGTPSDIKNNYNDNPDTFYGNYARIIEQIKNYAPNSKIILAFWYNDKLHNTTRSAFNDAVTNIANHYNIPKVEWSDDPFYNSSYIQDNLINNHPSVLQLSAIAYSWERLYSKCVENNYNYFSNYNGNEF